MNPSRLTLRKLLLEKIYNLAVLELMLEQAKDDYREAACEHNEIQVLFYIEQYMLDIKKNKYDIKHIEELLEQQRTNE